jgi:hypothetical protein
MLLSTLPLAAACGDDGDDAGGATATAPAAVTATVQADMQTEPASAPTEAPTADTSTDAAEPTVGAANELNPMDTLTLFTSVFAGDTPSIVEFLTANAEVTEEPCPPIEVPAFYNCAPEDSGPTAMRLMCAVASDCGGFPEGQYRQQLTDIIALAADRAPNSAGDATGLSDQYGGAGWEVYAWADWATPCNGVMPASVEVAPCMTIVVSALTLPVDSEFSRQVLLIDVQHGPAFETFQIQKITPYLGFHPDSNGNPLGFVASDGPFGTWVSWNRVGG